MNSPADWVDKQQWVRAYTRCSPDQTHAIGRVYSYCDAPTIGMETIDGRRIHWRADLCEPTVQTDETPIQKWQRTHPGVDIERYAVAAAALHDIQTDWTGHHGPLGLPEKYAGQHGWWL